MTRARPQTLTDVLLLALLAAAVLVMASNAHSARPFVVFLAACLVPGGALLTRLRTGHALTDLALAIGLSFAVEVAGGVLLAWAGWWHPAVLGAVLAGASAALLVADLVTGEH